MDAKLRDLERLARRGTDADKAAYLSALERAGQVPLAHLGNAALLGHAPSRLLFPKASFTTQAFLEAIHETIQLLGEQNACYFSLDLLIFELSDQSASLSPEEKSLLVWLRITRRNLTRENVNLLLAVAYATPCFLQYAVILFCDLWLSDRRLEAAGRAYITLSDLYWDSAMEVAMTAANDEDEDNEDAWYAPGLYREQIRTRAIPILITYLLPEAGI